ncbi:GNAT family N-acetyltransferase [Marinifilum sp. JC120]|nr:GNAT family N-acetyltransferase [Marinifilum sp. JC120]
MGMVFGVRGGAVCLVWVCRMIEIKSVSSIPQGMRDEYLDSLTKAQDLYLEELVREGAVWLMGDMGYAVVSGDSLVEFFVPGEFREKLIFLFDTLVDFCRIKQVLCKSFDSDLLFVSLSRQVHMSTVGLLFREIADSSFHLVEGQCMRPANEADIDTIVAFDDGFFHDRAEIEHYFAEGNLYAFDCAGSVRGCGIVTPVIAGRNYMDVGVLVAPEFRNQGCGAYIVSFLKSAMLEQGYNPICSCSNENRASAKALQRAGFVCGHRVLKFVF